MDNSSSIRLRPFLILAGLAIVGAVVHRPLANAIRNAGTRRRSYKLELSFNLNRPVEQVFGYFSNFENFPRFIPSLASVRDNGDGRSHWSATLSRGGTLDWESITTKFVTNSVIAWKSVAKSPVVTHGTIRFAPENGGTCVKLMMSYEAPRVGTRDALAALVRRSRSGRIESEIRRVERLIGEPRSASTA